MVCNYDEFQYWLSNLLSNGNGNVCPTMVNSPWGEAQCFYEDSGKRICASISWWREPPLPSELATWIGQECSFTEYEALMVSIHKTEYSPFNCIKDGVSEYGVVAEWEVYFNFPKSWTEEGN